MTIRLSGADFTWPLLSHPHVLGLIRMLELEGVDLGLMGNRSHLRPEVIRQDIPMWSGIVRERLDRAELEPSDVFGIPWTDFETMSLNNPDPSESEASWDFFVDLLEFARRIGSRHMTLLPGTQYDGDSWDESIDRSAKALQRRIEAAAHHGITVAVEAHTGSHVDTPEKAMVLLERTPGLTLTLDYCHFNTKGVPDEEIEPLLAHASHLQFRNSAPGRMQVKFRDNTIDYRRVVDRLMELGYAGWIGIEFVWMETWACDEVDNTMETIQLRDLVRAAMEGREYTPVGAAKPAPA